MKANGLTLLWLAWPCVCVFDGGNDEHQAAAAAAAAVSVGEVEDGIPDTELLTVVVVVVAAAPAAADDDAAAVAGEYGGDVAGGNSLTVLYLKT